MVEVSFAIAGTNIGLFIIAGEWTIGTRIHVLCRCDGDGDGQNDHESSVACERIHRAKEVNREKERGKKSIKNAVGDGVSMYKELLL